MLTFLLTLMLTFVDFFIFMREREREFENKK